MMMNQPQSPNPAIASLPTPAELQDAEWALRSMQRILGTLGRDRRREAPVFKELMDDYKHLGTNLHTLRREVAAAEQTKVKALAASRPAAPGQPGASLLDRVGQLRRPTPVAAAPRVASAVAPARSAAPLAARTAAAY